MKWLFWRKEEKRKIIRKIIKKFVPQDKLLPILKKYEEWQEAKVGVVARYELWQMIKQAIPDLPIDNRTMNVHIYDADRFAVEYEEMLGDATLEKIKKEEAKNGDFFKDAKDVIEKEHKDPNLQTIKDNSISVVPYVHRSPWGKETPMGEAKEKVNTPTCADKAYIGIKVKPTRSTTTDYALKILNEALAADPKAMNVLLKTKIPCNKGIAHHPTIQTQDFFEAFPLISAVTPSMENSCVGALSPLGLINGLFGVNAEGRGYITAVTDEHDKIIRFEATADVVGDA
jgi:hypothetical protein